MRRFNLFPFSNIEKGSKIAIYGGGVCGQDYLKQVIETSFCTISFIADKNYESRERLFGFEVCNPEAFRVKQDYDFVIIATSNAMFCAEMEQNLLNWGVKETKIVKNTHSLEVEKPKTYSQYGEDLLIVNAFRMMGYFKDGRLPSYIDVGANHPYFDSNTALLYQQGCRGINIECNPILIKYLEKERPYDNTLCLAIGSEDGVFPFYVCEANGLSSFRKENIELNEIVSNTKFDINEVLELPTKTLEFVISEYSNGIWPDFMSIDIEGMEYESLKNVDLSYGPCIIAVEVNFDGKLFTDMFSQKGYFPYLWHGSNIVFVKNEYKKMVNPCDIQDWIGRDN